MSETGSNHPTPAITASVSRSRLSADDSARASRRWWDHDATAYHAEHGTFLGESDFVWCPEGLRESDAGLLGPAADLRGRRVLEVGAGSAPCSRWLAGVGALPVGLDVSAGMLAEGRSAGRRTGTAVPLVQADAQALPLAGASFDLACSAFGAVPFVPDPGAVHREVHRVVRPGGRWVFSVTHPVRWCFPDDPGPDGLAATTSYFDRRAYVERDGEGRPVYVEHHHTVGDHVRALVAAGFDLLDVVEPEWPAGLDRTWAGWGPVRGEILPGTAIFVAHRR